MPGRPLTLPKLSQKLPLDKTIFVAQRCQILSQKEIVILWMSSQEVIHPGKWTQNWTPIHMLLILSVFLVTFAIYKGWLMCITIFPLCVVQCTLKWLAGMLIITLAAFFICLQCEFSNVFSRRRIITLVAFVWLFSTVCF